MNPSRTYEGSCLCQGVKYRIEEPFGAMENCHCTDCRKAHGAAFATGIDLPRKSLTFHQGENLLRRFKAQTGAIRSFCSVCGSTLIWESDERSETLTMAAATLDTPIHRKPDFHIFVSSKVPWFEITDGLPQYPKKVVDKSPRQ